jgi:predicted nucleic acid-binding Zn ribbon protein
MPVHVRVCRDCGEEYRPGIVRCADCGGELEDRFEGQEGEQDAEGASPAAEAVEEPAPELAGYRALFLVSRAAELVPMAERLRQAQVHYRLAEQPAAEGAPPRYALLVAPHGDSEEVRAVVTRFTEQGYVECPACGAHTAPGAAECPGCGLGLAGDEGGGEEPRG